MLETTGQSSATEPAGPRAKRGRGATLDVTGAVGLLATAIARARELPGRLADATELRDRLLAHRSKMAVSLAQAECDAVTSRRLGRDFTAHRARAEAQKLHEELADADAMIDEVERVLRRLGREARSLDHRLTLCAAFASELPAGPERARVVGLVERARAEIGNQESGVRSQGRQDEAIPYFCLP
jgi:hypothetical protein